MTKASELVRSILIAGSELGAVLFRNNVGRLQDRYGTFVQYGLCVGSPDVVGWRCVTVTPDMLGKQIAIFVGIECKDGSGRLREDQRKFLAALARDGAIQGVARSVADLDEILGPRRQTATSCGSAVE